MRRRDGAFGITRASLFAMLFVLCAAQARARSEIDPQELIRKVETQYQGERSHAIATMEVVTDSWSRELKMEIWSEGREKSLIRILSPKKEQGTATLKIGDEIWNYLPKIDRLMKIPSSLMGDSWMGSHFTNDDLVKENKIDQLYTFTVKSREGDQAVINCHPKPDAAVVWGRIEYEIDLEKTVPVEVRYFDEDDELVRTMSFDTVKKISGRWIPMRMLVKPEDKPDEKTVLTYEELEFGVDLADDRFTLGSIRGGG